jgi:hypothetical protein
MFGMAVSGMFVPQADWWPDVRAELLSFPAARHDDCADALGLIGQIADRMFAPSAPVPKPVPKVLSTDPALCTVTINDLWAQADRRGKNSTQRIL